MSETSDADDKTNSLQELSKNLICPHKAKYDSSEKKKLFFCRFGQIKSEAFCKKIKAHLHVRTFCQVRSEKVRMRTVLWCEGKSSLFTRSKFLVKKVLCEP
jgi:hypothetical protein